MIEEILEIATRDGVMGVVAKRPNDVGPHPVVLLFHDGPGIRQAIHDVVRQIAAEGYYVLAPDRYYRHGRFVSVEPEVLMKAGRDSEIMRNFFAMVISTTDDLIRTDIAALMDHLAVDPSVCPKAFGCIGYCNGVRTLLRTMHEYPGKFAAGVGLHPSFCVSPDADSPHHDVSTLAGKLYVAFGENDHIASVEHNQPLIDELHKLGEQATAEILPGSDHGFAVPGPNYHEHAAHHVYEKAIYLFRQTLI